MYLPLCHVTIQLVLQKLTCGVLHPAYAICTAMLSDPSITCPNHLFNPNVAIVTVHAHVFHPSRKGNNNVFLRGYTFANDALDEHRHRSKYHNDFYSTKVSRS